MRRSLQTVTVTCLSLALSMEAANAQSLKSRFKDIMASVPATGTAAQPEQTQDEANGERTATTVGAVAGGSLCAVIAKKQGWKALAVGLSAIGCGILGAKLGGTVYKRLKERDKAELAEKMQAMADDNAGYEDAAYGGSVQPVVWTAPESREQVTITPGATTRETMELPVALSTDVVAPEANFIVHNAKYRVSAKTLNLRAAPTVKADAIGSYSKDAIIETIGMTSDRAWGLVARNGVGIGYVSAEFLSSKLSVPRATVATKPQLKNKDVDTLSVKSVKIAASTTCQDLNIKIRSETDRRRGCQVPGAPARII